MPDKFLTARQIADILSCSTATVWRMDKDGRLPKALRLGGLTRWREADIYAVLYGENAPAEPEVAQ